MNKIIFGPIQNYRVDVARPAKVAKDIVNYLENYSDRMDMDVSSFTRSDKLKKNKQGVKLFFKAIAELPQKYIAENADKDAHTKITALVNSFRSNKRFMSGVRGIIEDYYSAPFFKDQDTVFCHDILNMITQMAIKLKDFN